MTSTDTDSSNSGSESPGSGSSSSLEEETFARPVFLKKSKAKDTPATTKQNAALQMAERLRTIEQKSIQKLPFDGVDDTDNLDPRAEFDAWQHRERSRRERDVQRIRDLEEAKEEAVRRKL